GQTTERLVQRQDLVGFLLDGDARLVEREMQLAAATLLAAPAPRVVDQDVAHDAGRHGEEVAPVFPLEPVETRELQVGLVDEGRGVEGASRPPSCELAAGEPAQVVVDQWDQPVESALLPR